MSSEPNPNPPPVIRAAWIDRTADDAFRVFTDEIGAWWPLPTHGLFGDRSGCVVFRDGKLVEQAVDGAEVVWGEVSTWDPPTRLVIAWYPGRDATEASEVEVLFEPHNDGTRVVIEHRGWQAFGEDAVNRRRDYVGPNAWGYVLDHYADSAEPHPDSVDVRDLSAAYDEFFAEAERGGFGSSPDGEWNAEQVIAHVALNDAAMLCVCQAMVHGGETRFENEVCQDPDVLANYIEEAGTMAVLIERGRSLSACVLASLQRLSSDQLQHEVHCCLSHDGQPLVDRPMPWAAVAVETQAAMHLPAHIDQLRNLR